MPEQIQATDNLKSMIEEFDVSDNQEMIDPERNYKATPIEDGAPSEESSIEIESNTEPSEPVETQSESTSDTQPSTDTTEIASVPAALSIPLKSFKQWIIDSTDPLADSSGFVVQDIRTGGVNTENLIAFTLPLEIPGIENNENESKDIFILKNCDKRRIPDKTPIEFKMINDFLIRVVQEVIENKLYFKNYSTENVLITVVYLKVDDNLIPYDIIKIKKKDDRLEADISEELVDSEIEIYRTKMNEGVDLETINLLYKQSAKADTTFVTYKDFYDWVYEKYAGIKDVNHLLQIDKAIISIFKDLR